MDLINQVAARLAEITRAMTPQARVVAGGALVVAVLCVAWMLAAPATPAETFLMGGEPFSAAQLRDMESAFGQAGLAEYHIDGARVRVPEGQQAKYMAALAEAGALPADFGEHLRKAVEGSGFMLYGERQQAQLKVAIQSELQGLINHFQGIERSFVQIAEETSRGFPQVKTVTASVGVQPARNQPIDARTASAIRWIVANAWGGLKPENVTVLDLSTKQLFAGPLEGDTSTAPGGPYAETKKQLERDWQEKIARLLGIPGLIVTVNVELADDGRTSRRVSASVAVPQSYFETVWRQRQRSLGADVSLQDSAALAAVEREECQRIRSAIEPLLSTSGERAAGENLLAVTTIYTADPPAPIDETPAAIAWQFALDNWQPLAVGLAVLAGLIVLRSAFRPSSAATEPTPGEPQPSLQLVVDEPQAAPAAPRATQPTPEPQSWAGTLREELTDVVRRDPAAAASVLRTWIGNAS